MAYEQPSVHALAFRVMRLSRPGLHVHSAPLRVDLDQDMKADGADAAPSSPSDAQQDSQLGPEPVPFADRVQLSDLSQLMGFNGLLELPQSFGTIYLGESFSSYISVGNYSDEEVSAVGVKAELQTERQKWVLYDNTSSPLTSIAPGGRHDFVVRHDIKELGPHTLMCSTVYTSPKGDRKFMPQYFKFAASNPLSVRTKTRQVLDTVFLEACLENLTKSPLMLEYVRFDPAPSMRAEQVDVRDSGLHRAGVEGPLSEYISSLQVIGPSGGALNFLYRLRREARPAGSRPTPKEVGNTLGKLEMKWRNAMGEVGRLQTQQIMGVPDARKEVELQVEHIPEGLRLGVPFEVQVRVRSNVDRRVGPLFVGASPASAGLDSLRATSTAGGGVGGHQHHGPHGSPAVMMHGHDSLAVGELDPYGALSLRLTLVALRHGVQRVAGIQLFDTREVKVYDSLHGVEVFVQLA